MAETDRALRERAFRSIEMEKPDLLMRLENRTDCGGSLNHILCSK